jgi:hypothetical protein
MIGRADKSRIMVIIDKNAPKHKVSTFMQEYQTIRLNKDPTAPFQKHIQQKIQQCDILMHKRKTTSNTNITNSA